MQNFVYISLKEHLEFYQGLKEIYVPKKVKNQFPKSILS